MKNTNIDLYLNIPESVDLHLDIQKGGGEGSRGGKVVGHTKSGKPIYESKSGGGSVAAAQKEHDDAMEKLNTLASKLNKEKDDGGMWRFNPPQEWIDASDAEIAASDKLEAAKQAEKDKAYDDKIKAEEDAEKPKGDPNQMSLFRSNTLYLDIEKGNPNRDPMSGVYLKGGSHKEKTRDLNDEMLALMDQMPGEDLDKD